MGTPHRVCRTFARLDFILVPLPAARTTAKIGELSDMYPHNSYRSSGRPSRTALSSAGAAGFEPAIPGPKPGALPLGYAPVKARADYTGAPFRRQKFGSSNLHPAGDRLVDADKGCIDLAFRVPSGFFVGEYPVDCSTATAHRSPKCP